MEAIGCIVNVHVSPIDVGACISYNICLAGAASMVLHSKVLVSHMDVVTSAIYPIDAFADVPAAFEFYVNVINQQ
jgi:hypothetical protein